MKSLPKIRLIYFLSTLLLVEILNCVLPQKLQALHNYFSTVATGCVQGSDNKMGVTTNNSGTYFIATCEGHIRVGKIDANLNLVASVTDEIGEGHAITTDGTYIYAVGTAQGTNRWLRKYDSNLALVKSANPGFE